MVVGIVLRPAHLRFMAKKELFELRLLGRLVGALGAFPIDRGAGDRAALETSLAVLAEGGVLMMFPEGHRYPDDEIHDFQPGVGMLALRSGAPVIPVVSKGTPAMWRDGRPRLPGAARPGRRADRPVRTSGPGQRGLRRGGAPHARGGGGALWAALRTRRAPGSTTPRRRRRAPAAPRVVAAGDCEIVVARDAGYCYGVERALD